MNIKMITLENEINNLEKSIQELTTAQLHIAETYSRLDHESANVLMTAASLVVAIANQKSEEMNKKILEKERLDKESVNCKQVMRCFMCGKKEYGECKI